MVARITTVAFQGIEALEVDVQVQITSGLPAFNIVGLGDKAVSESRERIRSTFHAIGLALPAKRITVNLAPADMQKEGSHYDLPIALALLVAMDVLPQEKIQSFVAMGELALDGQLMPVSGVLPAAVFAASQNKGMICSEVCGPEAVWGGNINIIAPRSLLSLLNYFQGKTQLDRPIPVMEDPHKTMLDLSDIKGQEIPKRALEIAAAGGHNLLMIGPPGAGKSMLAQRLPTILPLLEPQEALEISMVHSIAGYLNQGKLFRHRPFRDPHHSASLPSLVGGGHKALPGEISLAHTGVLFLDELPEFSRSVLESLRQPMETGKVTIARANAHVSYPAKFQMVAAMNPCRCGYLDEPMRACSKAPRCGQNYQAKISGPILDRIDLFVYVASVPVQELSVIEKGETSQFIRERVAKARAIQKERYKSLDMEKPLLTNAECPPNLVEKFIALDHETKLLMHQAIEKFHLSARGYHRILRVARTIADLSFSEDVKKVHLAEALSFRQP